MKNVKTAVIASALVLAAVMSMTACKKTVDEQPDNPVNNGEQQDGQNQNNGENTDNEKKFENPDAPSLNVSFEPLKDTITLKESGELMFEKSVDKIQLTSGENGNTESTRKIGKVMQAANDASEKEAKKEKQDCMDYLENGNDIVATWTFETKYEITKNNAYAVSFLEQTESYTGGAHPSNYKFGYNFDAQTGDQITFITLFGDSEKNADEYLAFETAIRTKLEEIYGKDALDEIDAYLGYNDVENSIQLLSAAEDSWVFTDDGIKVMYNAYDIAPYAAGSYEISFSADEFKALCPAAEKYLA